MNKDRRKRIRCIATSVSALADELYQIRDQEQDAFDNMPENLQESERGQVSQNCCDDLDEAIDSLQSAANTLNEMEG